MKVRAQTINIAGKRVILGDNAFFLDGRSPYSTPAAEYHAIKRHVRDNRLARKYMAKALRNAP